MSPGVAANLPQGPAAARGRALASLEWLALAVLAALFVWKGLLPAWWRLNTDFPNYYLAAKLYRDGAPLDRLYDWTWFQRQKDHAGLGEGVAGYGLLSPFSALVLLPLASLPPLTAKHGWLAINLLLLVGTILLLRSMTRLSLRRVAILAFLTVVPLRTCFEFGQQHLLILFLLTLAGWLYLRGHELSSGAVLAVAAALKLYPALFAVFFLLKGRWRALTALCVTSAVLVAIGAALLGPDTLRVYATSVLPRSFAGEGTDPYYLGTNTLTVLLRRMFVAEPDLNPHPILHVPAAYSVLQPTIQTLLLLSALWVGTSAPREGPRERLEWGAFVALLMVLSTASATYHFCALIVATVLGVDALLGAGRPRPALALGALHGLVCAPLYRFFPASPSGWTILLGAPRLFALFAYWTVFAWSFARVSVRPRRRPWEAGAFGLAFVLLTLFGIVSNLRHFNGQFESSAARLIVKNPALIATAPAVGQRAVYFSRVDDDSYVLDRTGGDPVTRAARGPDVFFPAVAAGVERGWAEVSSLTSRVSRFPLDGIAVSAADLPVEIEDGEQPAVTADGRWLGFIREHGGHGSLWVRSLEPNAERPADRQRVDATFDVLDFGFFPDDRLILAARQGASSRLFVASATAGPLSELYTSDRPARFPAISPDGRRLVYGLEERGSWQLQLMDLATREQRRLTHADCNSVMPAFTPDSNGIVYASDCGRGVGMTALCRMSLALEAR